MTKKPEQITYETLDSYSANRYGNREWVNCAAYLQGLGLSDADVETVLRSKVMRWAADDCNNSDDYFDYPTVADLRNYVESCNHPFVGLSLRSKVGRANA
jgi:hypothetical protein